MKKPRPEPEMPASIVNKAQTFVAGGGEVAAEKKAKAKSDKLIAAYTLRIYNTKLEELGDVRDQRKAELLAKGRPDRNTISVHSLILEAVDEFLANEAKRAAKRAAKQDGTKAVKK